MVVSEKIAYVIHRRFCPDGQILEEKFEPAKEGDQVHMMFGSWPEFKPMRLVSSERKSPNIFD